MKYIGSKAKFADEIVAILQGYISEYKIKQYVEPFAGGFNVIDKVQCEYRLGNDIDPLVCDLIETCRDNPALLDSLHTPFPRGILRRTRQQGKLCGVVSCGGAFIRLV